MGTFFRSAVDEVRSARRLQTSEAATSYVVGVLVEFAAPKGNEIDDFDGPLTFLVYRALGEHGPDGFERLRQLGDLVLYLSGFFGEYFERRGVGQAYVTRLGSQAYWAARHALAGLGPAPESPSVAFDVFAELASNFDSFVTLLNGVAWDLPGSRRGGDSDLLGLYERWLKSRSPTLGAKLGAAGLIPLAGSSTVH